MKTNVETPEAPLPKTSPHSQAIIANGFLFTQGSICLTTEGKLLEGTVEEQVHQIMKNLETILKAGGTSFDNVVKSTIYLTDMSLYGKVNEIYGSHFTAQYIARETVCVQAFPLGAQVEISMIAITQPTP